MIAWINYINLSTAKSIERAKEVGVRKVIGANRVQLIKQFFTESFLINVTALFFACTLVQLSGKWFNEIAAKAFQYSIWQDSTLGCLCLPSLWWVLSSQAYIRHLFYLLSNLL
jgi:putative ABC transport system permease protein